MASAKVIRLFGALVLMLGFWGQPAAADEEFWAVWMTVGDGNNGSFTSPSGGSGGRVNVGTRPGSYDTVTWMDQYDGLYPPPQIAPAALISLYRPGWMIEPGASWTWLKDFRAPLFVNPSGSVAHKIWRDIVVWTSPGFHADVLHLYVFSPQSVAPPGVIAGRDMEYRLRMTHAPESYTGPREWLLKQHSGADEPELLLEVVLPMAGTLAVNPVVGSGPDIVQVAGYRFDFMTPEPGSLLILAGGAVGLAGQMRRRR